MPRLNKPAGHQPFARRAPRQGRALEKVELILEAAIRLLERDGIESLTTNALAETAGVSIGTLYQYFHDKNAVLAALADREMTAMSKRLMASLAGAPPAEPGERIRAVVRAVLAAYGGRRKAHRLIMAHAMSRGGTGKLNPLFARLTELFTAQGVGAPGVYPSKPLSPADAFVLMHAIAGVLKTMATHGENLPPREEIEAALAKLVLRFVQPEK
jgi:AcrR family transcriptional regulator